MSLSLKKKRFINEYLKDLNATQAAMRSGYSEKTAKSQGQRLLTNVDIQREIQKRMKDREKRTEVTQDMVIKELASIAFSDLADYIEIVEDTGAIRAKSFNEMAEGKSRALQSIKEDRVIKEDAKGEQITVYDKINFKLYDKVRALELLGKHLGMFVEKIEHSGSIKTTLSISDLKQSIKDYDESRDTSK